MLMAFAVFDSMAQTINVTAYQKNRVVNADSTVGINPSYIVDAYRLNSVNYVDYDQNKNGTVTEFRTRETPDSIAKLSNLYKGNLVKLRKAMSFGGKSDSFNTFYFNIDNIKSVVAGTNTYLSFATSKMNYKYFNNYVTYPIVESKTRIKALVDSIQNYPLSNGASATRYDTSTLTMAYTDKHIILNSTTADTLVLLDPTAFYQASPLVVANIGSGAYTLTGGFTVKDKSGSTVSSLTANTVYTFKSYYTGSAYIWLKEY